MQVEISVKLEGLDAAANALKRPIDIHSLQATKDAVHAGTQALQAEWMKYISGSPVTYSGGTFTIHRVSGNYASAVMGGLEYPFQGNVLKGGVTVNLEYADRLERGLDSYDMKSGLLSGSKVKTTKDGTPFIDIPFRHNEEDIPASIKKTTRKGDIPTGAIRLGPGLGKGLAGQRSKIAPKQFKMEPYTWRAGLFTSLQRKSTGGKSGSYMTFRRVSRNSDPSSWIHPGTDPKPVTKALEENMGPGLERMVAAGFRLDIVRIAFQGGGNA